MSLIVELWVDGRVREGADEWWDDVEALLPDDAAARFPLLSRVDPYGDATFVQSEFAPLASEFEAVAVRACGRSLALLRRLVELCKRGMTADDAELRFIGD